MIYWTTVLVMFDLPINIVSAARHISIQPLLMTRIGSCFQDLNGQLPASQDALSISGPTSVSNYFSRPQITFSTETDFYGCSKSSDSQLFGSDLCESSDTAQPILEENDVRQNHPLFETTPDALSPQLVSMGKGKTPVSRMRLGNGHLSRDPSEGLLEFQGTGVALGINLQTNQTPHTAATQDAIGDNAVVAVNSRKDSPKLNARKFKCHWCGRVVGGLPNIKMHLSACDVLGIQQTWVCLTHPKSPPYHQKHLYQKHHFNYHHAECGVDKATDCPHAENVLQDLAASKLAYGCGVCRAYVKPGELVDHLKQHYKEAHGRDEGWIPWTYNDAFRGLLKQPLPWTENQASGVRSRPWTIQSLINKHARQAGYTDESFDDFVWVEETSSELYEDLQCNARGTSEEFIDQLAYNIYWHMVSSLLHYNRNPTDNAQLDYSTHLSPANAHVSDDFW